MRPDWASGAEWEGWSFNDGADPVGLRDIDYDTAVYIFPSGKLRLAHYTDEQGGDMVAEYTFPSPESALRVANCIAAELGGWES